MRFRLKLHNSIGDSCWSLHQSKPSSAITANYNLRFLCGRMLASWGSVTQLNSISLLFGQSRLSQFLRRPTWGDFFFLVGEVFGFEFYWQWTRGTSYREWFAGKKIINKYNCCGVERVENWVIIPAARGEFYFCTSAEITVLKFARSLPGWLALARRLLNALQFSGSNVKGIRILYPQTNCFSRVLIYWVESALIETYWANSDSVC